MIGSFSSGATASLVAKNGTKNYLRFYRQKQDDAKKVKKVFSVPFFTTRGVVVPLENDPIMSGRFIQSF